MPPETKASVTAAWYQCLQIPEILWRVGTGPHIFGAGDNTFMPLQAGWLWQKQAVRLGLPPSCQVGDLPGHMTLCRCLPCALSFFTHQMKEPNICQVLTGCKQLCQRAWMEWVCISEGQKQGKRRAGEAITGQDDGHARGEGSTGKGLEVHGEQEGDQEKAIFPGQLWILEKQGMACMKVTLLSWISCRGQRQTPPAYTPKSPYLNNHLQLGEGTKAFCFDLILFLKIAFLPENFFFLSQPSSSGTPGGTMQKYYAKDSFQVTLKMVSSQSK